MPVIWMVLWASLSVVVVAVAGYVGVLFLAFLLDLVRCKVGQRERGDGELEEEVNSLRAEVALLRATVERLQVSEPGERR